MRALLLFSLLVAMRAGADETWCSFPVTQPTRWDNGYTAGTPLPDTVPLETSSALSREPDHLWWGSLPGAVAGPWAPAHTWGRPAARSERRPPAVVLQPPPALEPPFTPNVTVARRDNAVVDLRDAHLTIDDARALIVSTKPPLRLTVLQLVAVRIVDVQRLDELLPLFDPPDRPYAAALLAD